MDIVHGYALTNHESEVNKCQFYDRLTYPRENPGKYLIILTGKLNAKVGIGNARYGLIIGRYGLWERNENVERLVYSLGFNSIVIDGNTSRQIHTQK